MNTLDVHEQTQNKLTTYRLEAEVQRQLSKSVWRNWLRYFNQLLKKAERLEAAFKAAIS